MEKRELEQKVEELEKRAQELTEKAEARKAEEERQKAFYEGNHKMTNTENRAWKQIADAILEKRAISYISIESTIDHDTANGIGRVNQIADLWDLIKQKEPLLDRVSYFNGPNFETQIPVLEGRPAVPASKVSEGYNSNEDSIYRNAPLAVKKLNPETYIAILPITYEAAKQSFVGLEDRIPGLLAECFRTTMCNLVFDGLFDEDNFLIGSDQSEFVLGENQVKEAASADGITIADLEALALEILDTDVAEPVILMNPHIYGTIAAADADGYDFLKEELVRNKTVEGIKVVLSGKAPAYGSAEAGDVVVWGGDLKNYALGVADQITIEPIKKLGDTNTYYQAVMAFSGAVIQPKNVFGISKKAGL